MAGEDDREDLRLAYPVGLWLRDGRPPSKELHGEAAAERLGIPPGSLNEATNTFATKWTA